MFSTFRYYRKNKTRLDTYRRKYAMFHPNKTADYGLKSRWGISLIEYNRMFKKQNGRCAICNRPERMTLRGKIKRLAVDHSHKTGKIRKLLCAYCNRAIGLLDEDTKLLKKAINYLKVNNA